jgi:hypothetical protein
LQEAIKSGRPWVFNFPKQQSLGTVSQVGQRGSGGPQAKGKLVFPEAKPLIFTPNWEVANESLTYRRFRPDDIYRLQLASNDRITDDTLLFIDHLTGLKVLTLEDTEVTDKGLAHLKTLSLNYLTAPSAVTGEGLSQLNLKSLTGLKANEVKGVSKVLEDLPAASPAFGFLCLKDDDLSNDDLDKIARLSALHMLEIARNARVTDQGIKKLIKLKHLKSLDIRELSITPACIEYLSKMPALKELLITNSAWSEKDRIKLRQAIPNCTLNPDLKLFGRAMYW